jgi:DNA-binding HxlR family transcriptional regulator
MRFDLIPVAPGSGDAEHCPVRNVLDCIGDKWSLLTLMTLTRGTLRFSELKRGIGDISQRMLAKTLRQLEADGYVSRKVYPTVPPKVEYRLLHQGESLLEHIGPLVNWAIEHHDAIRESRKAYVPPEAEPAK